MRRTLVSLLLLAGLSTPALADTVYLKNGRVLRAARVTVTDDKVILEQAGNRIEFPRSLVERIEKDPMTSEVLDPVDRDAPAEPPADAEGDDDEGDDDEGDDDGEDSEEGDEEEAEVDPKETRAWWQEQMQGLEDQREELRERLEELEREERAFLFSHRSTAEVKRQIEEVETSLAELDEREQELRREARRLRVPPGWLRIRG